MNNMVSKNVVFLESIFDWLHAFTEHFHIAFCVVLVGNDATRKES